MNEDLLDRWRLAKEIYTIVRETPSDWSCRIGIYGKWGEGKTSVLRFVETQAQSDGLICLWVNPSPAENADDLWRIVIEAFLEALDRERILVEEARSWRFKLLAKKSESLDKLAEANSYAKALVGFGRAALKEWFLPDGDQMRKIRKKIHAGKVVVFIDDLDRTHPDLVPALLLGLRDLLDLPGFAFVLAFDAEIISQALLSVNSAWGDGFAFLDKILDFSFQLPKPSAEQRLELLKFHLKKLCPWMKFDVIEQNSDLLPDTARKVKILIRNLMTLGPQIRRHDPAEIQWIDLLMGQLVRVESPGFLDTFLKNGHESLIEVGAHAARRNDQSSFEEQLEKAVAQSGASGDALQARLVKMLKSWSERRAFVPGRNLVYFARFGITHRYITRREYEGFIEAYRQSQDYSAVETQLEDHAERMNVPIGDVTEEFLDMVLEARTDHLKQAADAVMETDTMNFLAKAKECLRLINQVLSRQKLHSALPQKRIYKILENIAAQAFYWMHFDKAVYQPTREEEREFLLAASKDRLLTGFEWLDLLLPWTDRTLFVNQEVASDADRLIDELLLNLRELIVNEALKCFTTPGSYVQFYGAKGTRAVRFCSFDPKSPVWQDDGRARLFDTLGTVGANPAIGENAFELLSCLSSSRAREGFVAIREHLQQILPLPKVANSLWTAANAERIQYRFLGRYVQLRSALIRDGIPANDLPVSESLEKRIKELDKGAEKL